MDHSELSAQKSWQVSWQWNPTGLRTSAYRHLVLTSHGTNRWRHAVLIHIKTMTGELVPLSALVIPTIATPINNPLNTGVLQLSHLKGLPQAHLVTAAGNFEISLLVGADFYWDLVGDHIVWGDRPTAMSSKSGYLLSGLVLLPGNPSAIINILHVAAEHDPEVCNLLKFWQIEDTAISTDVVRNPDQQFLKS